MVGVAESTRKYDLTTKLPIGQAPRPAGFGDQLELLNSRLNPCTQRGSIYCLMSNHVHLLVETGSTPSPGITYLSLRRASKYPTARPINTDGMG
jgi:hypothetical protein